MASIYERKKADGTSCYRVQIRKKGVKQITNTFSSKEEAERYSNMIEISLDEKPPIMELPLCIYIDRFIDENPSISKCKNTYLYDLWREYLGDCIATNIKSYEIEKFLNFFIERKGQKGAIPSPETVRKFTCALSAVYTKAIKEWKWCTYNPVSDVSSYYKKNNRAYKTIQIDEDIKNFKILLKNKICEALPNTTSKEQRIALGIQKTCFNYLFDPRRGTTINLLVSSLKRIGLTIDIVPIKENSATQEQPDQKSD